VAHQNNFEIFRTAWDNLIAGRGLYGPSARHRDFYLYSPTFALLFAPFAVTPRWLGALLWTALNAGVLYAALGWLLPPRDAFMARAIVFIDAIGSMQQAQSNALVTGLMIAGFVALERRREGWGAGAVAVGTAIKIFPLVAAVTAIFRPYRLARFALWAVVWGIVLTVAPLLVTSPSALVEQYRSWAAAPSPVGVGYSVMAVLRVFTGLAVPDRPFQLIGVVILLAPLMQLPHWGSSRFRLLFLASTLMFCVLFNHAAESPSFVIAAAGVALWFVAVPRTRFSWGVLALFILGSTLVSSSAMPEAVGRGFFEAYRTKTLPVLLVWVLTQRELWRRSASAPFDSPGAAPATAAA